VTGLPDFHFSYYVRNAAGNGTANLLVVPDGSGAPLTQARRADGTIADTDTDAECRTRWTLPQRAGGISRAPCGIVINGATPPACPRSACP